MRVFVAIVEEGSLSAAARRLHLSQPALSQTVGSLERHLGVRLLVRSSTGMATTPEGQTLLDEARAVLARHDQALVALDRQSAREVGVLRLGLPLDVPPPLLIGPLGELAAAYPAPGVRAHHLAPALLEAALRHGELDAALLRERPRGQELDCLLVMEEQLGVLLTTRQAERLGGPGRLSLEALAGLLWVGFPREDAPGYFDEVTAVLGAHGIEVARAVTGAAGDRTRGRLRLGGGGGRGLRAGSAVPGAPGHGRVDLVPAGREPAHPPHLGRLVGQFAPSRSRALHRRLRHPGTAARPPRATRPPPGPQTAGRPDRVEIPPRAPLQPSPSSAPRRSVLSPGGLSPAMCRSGRTVAARCEPMGLHGNVEPGRPHRSGEGSRRRGTRPTSWWCSGICSATSRTWSAPPG
jgi:DNA-binding transcriptional LysR family regulator